MNAAVCVARRRRLSLSCCGGYCLCRCVRRDKFRQHFSRTHTHWRTGGAPTREQLTLAEWRICAPPSCHRARLSPVGANETYSRNRTVCVRCACVCAVRFSATTTATQQRPNHLYTKRCARTPRVVLRASLCTAFMCWHDVVVCAECDEHGAVCCASMHGLAHGRADFVTVGSVASVGRSVAPLSAHSELRARGSSWVMCERLRSS